ncbi:MAG: hypothetical protein A2622_10790 [Bdellovibrionales bacterium RIFCSPHIGHO2_01_FULL_40_29]|nr:MAG: hypothetical protein A2622_10790 [Bdellovibrionales bacterium RIFCSPHIGHO2_01_FULL_40_29]OFZ34442.1 MAG: hypothetical protein A3D17_01055 [Bdellovibrionales bacterium RIFCSPHIGHO2_02_FULL_40_15]
MKIKSNAGKSVYFEQWSTPLDQVQSLWLSKAVMSASCLHLIFEQGKGTPNVKYVLTLNRRWPIRFTEEAHAVGCIGKYFETDSKNNKFPHNKKGYPIRTWKLWSTKYIKEINTNHSLSDYKRPKYKDIPQYLIITGDEWIEFIADCEPDWTIHKHTSIQKLIDSYSKKNYKPRTF